MVLTRNVKHWLSLTTLSIDVCTRYACVCGALLFLHFVVRILRLFFFFVIHFLFSSFVSTFGTDFYMVFLWVIWSTDSARYESRRLMPIAHPIQTIVKPTHIECNQQEQAIAKHTHIFCVECWPRPSSSHTHTQRAMQDTNQIHTTYKKASHRIAHGKKICCDAPFIACSYGRSGGEWTEQQQEKKTHSQRLLMVFVSNSSSSGLWI